MYNFRGIRWKLLVVVVLSSLVVATVADNRAVAVSRDYTIVFDQSSVAISGTVFATALNQTRPILEQGPGSLTSKYTGTIKTDRDLGMIQFLTGSSIDASVSGNWQPLADAADGSAPADYGGVATFTVIFPVPVYFAGRELIGDVSSGALVVDGSNQFNLGGANLTFTSGSIAYRALGGTPAATQTIVGYGGALSLTGTLGTLAEGGLVYETLKMPIAVSFQFGDTQATINLTLSGEINARYLIPSSNGDYNQNGFVDAADYVVWRASVGQTGVGLAADGNGDNQITTADYDVWRSKFGTAVGSGAGLTEGTVPEPTSFCVLIATAAILAFVRRPTKRRR